MPSNDTPKFGACACGCELREYTGAGATGLLCPSCDDAHARELQLTRVSCSYERTLHAARAQEGLSIELAATISIVALRYGPHGRLRVTLPLRATP